MLKIHQRRYLGSKTKLLDFISNIIVKEKMECHTFADLFAGTGVVSSHMNKDSKVITNDLLYSNYLSHLAFMGSEEVNQKLMEKILSKYNSIESNKIPDNYFSLNFSDTYFSHENCKIIGFIRDDIQDKKESNAINDREFAYLVTSLIYSIDRIANTVGHYDAYRKNKEGLQRKLLIDGLDIQSHKTNAKNQIYNTDANDLASSIKADIVYLDPPYNSRQYSDNYHLLENIAEWKKSEVFGVAKKMNRTHIKSKYNNKTAAQAFSELIEKLDTKYILVSYNDMGANGCSRSQAQISDHEIISALERRGGVKVYSMDFKQFTTGSSKKDDLKERIFVCSVGVYTDKKKVNEINNFDALLPKKKSFKSKLESKKKYIKSPLNYTGGKYRLLDQIIPFIPEDVETFYDVFSGGGNVGINAPGNSTICIDSNEKVIRIQNLIQRYNFDELHYALINRIDKFGLSRSYEYGYEAYGCESSKGLGSYNKKKYIELKDQYNSLQKSEEKDFLLLILIIYGFNNQIRFNSKGEYNLPVGKRDYNGSVRENLLRFNEASKNKDIKFITSDFRDLLDMEIQQKDFVYLDPPYILGTASYNESGGWSEEDELDLLSILKKLDLKGIKFALSNVIEHKGQEHIHLKNWANENNYHINNLTFNYNNSNYQSKAKQQKTSEVLITNYNIINATKNISKQLVFNEF